MTTQVQNAATLSQSEREFYAANGFLVSEFRVDPSRIEELRAGLNRLIANNPGRRPEHLISAHVSGDNSDGTWGDEVFLKLAQDPEIVELVSQLIGPDVILWGCMVFCKNANDGMEVPWHQDGYYWPIEPLETCTVWVALDESTVDNGCMQVIPGSHKNQQLLAHYRESRDDVVLNETVAANSIDTSQAVNIELKPGQMSMHDVFVLHGSGPNRSGQRRAGVAIRYMPGSSHFNRGSLDERPASVDGVDFSNRPIWLLKGRDRTGKNDFTIGHK